MILLPIYLLGRVWYLFPPNHSFIVPMWPPPSCQTSLFLHPFHFCVVLHLELMMIRRCGSGKATEIIRNGVEKSKAATNLIICVQCDVCVWCVCVCEVWWVLGHLWRHNFFSTFVCSCIPFIVYLSFRVCSLVWRQNEKISSNHQHKSPLPLTLCNALVCMHRYASKKIVRA
jgi:hypothetical protein